MPAAHRPFRNSPLARRLLVAVMAAVATAGGVGCSNLAGTDTQPNRYGALNIVARNAGAGRAAGQATVIFFKDINVSVPNSALQQYDQCVISGIDTTTSTTTGMNTVGSALALAIAGTAVPLTYNTGRLRYESSGSQPLTYAGGDSATLTVPEAGDVFPASTLTVKLAEPIVPQAITLPAAASDWTIRWNGTNDNLSSIQLQLRYGTSASGTVATEQVYCVLRDDGVVAIPSTYLGAFLAAPGATRSVRLMRWRTNERLLDARTLLHLASTVDTVITF